MMRFSISAAMRARASASSRTASRSRSGSPTAAAAGPGVVVWAARRAEAPREPTGHVPTSRVRMPCARRRLPWRCRRRLEIVTHSDTEGRGGMPGCVVSVTWSLSWLCRRRPARPRAGRCARRPRRCAGAGRLVAPTAAAPTATRVPGGPKGPHLRQRHRVRPGLRVRRRNGAGHEEAGQDHHQGRRRLDPELHGVPERGARAPQINIVYYDVSASARAGQLQRGRRQARRRRSSS